MFFFYFYFFVFKLHILLLLIYIVLIVDYGLMSHFDNITYYNMDNYSKNNDKYFSLINQYRESQRFSINYKY